MRNLGKAFILIIAPAFSLCNFHLVYATPSTHIWAPSTDIQGYGTGHITADVYIPTGRNSDGTRPNAITNTGLTFGILPFKKFNAEAGFDYKTGYGSLDRYPMYFNGKIGIPEGVLEGYIPYGELSPAVAGGIYDVGTKVDKTNYNIVYAKAAKTISVKDFSLGRFSFGYFWGNDELLLGKNGEKDWHGILVAWERTMSEISDKLWLCVEYQGTKSSYGALNLGGSWQFTKDISVICGYQFYNNSDLAGTTTIQVDINF